MKNENEIALEQALIAVLGAVQDLDLGVDQVAQKASALVIGHSAYRQVEHPHVTAACLAIESALKVVKAKA